MSEPVPPADLIARCRQGDDRARELLFERYRPYLHVLANAQLGRQLRAKTEASDLVQQTLLEAYRDFGRFRGSTEAEWLAWLRRILAHNAANFVRQYRGTAKRQARREVTLGRPGDTDAGRGPVDAADPAETPSQYLLRKERELQVADALAGLSPDHREVILLRNLQRLPFDEVARRMGRSRPAVQMLWLRAVRKLQDDARLKPVAP